MTWRRIGFWAFWIFLGWWVITNPHHAADVVHHIGALGSRALTGISTFVSSL